MDAIKRTAERCLAAGISVLPIGDNKMPAIKWKPLIDKPLDSWDFPGCNMAIVTGATNGIVVVDCDSRRNALAWLAHMPPTPLISLSSRGAHFYYRHPGEYVKSDSHIQNNGITYDVKADRSYVLAPPSTRNGHTYRFVKHPGNPSGKWMSPELLPVFNRKWRPERAHASTAIYGNDMIRDVRAYIERISATEGQRDRETYRVCRLVLENGIDERDAMAIVVDWHMRKCTPPWDPMEVAMKVRRVYENGGRLR